MDHKTLIGLIAFIAFCLFISFTCEKTLPAFFGILRALKIHYILKILNPVMIGSVILGFIIFTSVGGIIKTYHHHGGGIIYSSSEDDSIPERVSESRYKRDQLCTNGLMLLLASVGWIALAKTMVQKRQSPDKKWEQVSSSQDFSS